MSQVVQQSLIILEGESQIILKKQTIDVVNEDNKSFYENKINQLIPFSLKTHFDINQSFFQNKSNQSSLPANFYTQDKQNIVYEYLEFIKQVCCDHQTAGAKVQCDVCQKFYNCRYCHDETHRFKFGGQVECNKCQVQQKFNKNCINCNYQFCEQHCDQCGILTLFKEDVKPMVHCSKCQRCIVGLRENIKHCDKCNRCIYLPQFDGHRCLQQEQCPVCLDTFSNQNSIIVLECCHALHKQCYEKLIFQVDECPLCKQPASFGKLKEIFYIAKEKLYQEYVSRDRINQFVYCRCKLCHYKFLSRDRNCLKCFQCNEFQVIKGTVNQQTDAYTKYISQPNVDEPIQILSEQIKVQLKQNYLPIEIKSIEDEALQQLINELGVKNDKMLVNLLKNVVLPDSFSELLTNLHISQ